MSRAPFDPRELDDAGDELGGIGRRLDDYVRETAAVEPSPLLSARVMSALPEDEPRRGVMGIFAAGVRVMRAAPLAVLLVLLVGFGGVVAVGHVTGAFRILPIGSPEPSRAPLPVTTAMPDPTAGPSLNPVTTPNASPSMGPSAAPSESGSPETPSPSPTAPVGEPTFDASPTVGP